MRRRGEPGGGFHKHRRAQAYSSVLLLQNIHLGTELLLKMPLEVLFFVGRIAFGASHPFLKGSVFYQGGREPSWEGRLEF